MACAGWACSGSVEKNLREHAYRRFYMHKTGHWLGLDVHDVGDYRIDGEYRVLEPGMVVTVEPGLYIAPDQKGVPAKIPRHRHPHRGRRGGHCRRAGSDFRRRSEGRRGDRGADGARLTDAGRSEPDRGQDPEFMLHLQGGCHRQVACEGGKP